MPCIVVDSVDSSDYLRLLSHHIFFFKLHLLLGHLTPQRSVYLSKQQVPGLEFVSEEATDVLVVTVLVDVFAKRFVGLNQGVVESFFTEVNFPEDFLHLLLVVVDGLVNGRH